MAAEVVECPYCGSFFKRKGIATHRKAWKQRKEAEEEARFIVNQHSTITETEVVGFARVHVCLLTSHFFPIQNTHQLQPLLHVPDPLNGVQPIPPII